MTLGNTIAYYRKKLNITQDALAKQLEVTNQAVSKWESDLCCPDIMLLPKMADIFGISIDALFGREDKAPQQEPQSAQSVHVDWADDNTLRAVLFIGRTLVGGHPAAKEIQFRYEGPALNVHSAFSVTCDDVHGDVHAGSDVTCDDVDGDVRAGGDVTCDEVSGNVQAGSDVTCDDIGGNVYAGGDITCDEIGGSAQGCHVHFE